MSPKMAIEIQISLFNQNEIRVYIIALVKLDIYRNNDSSTILIEFHFLIYNILLLQIPDYRRDILSYCSVPVWIFYLKKVIILK